MDSVDNQVALSSEDYEACLDALSYSTSLAFPMCFNAAIELDLFSIIAKAGPGAHISASEVALQLPTQNPDAASTLDRLLHLLASYSLLTCSFRTLEDDRVEKLYGLTTVSKHFVRSSDGVSLTLQAFGFHPAIMQVCVRMKDAILEGGDLFKRVHGVSMFQYMNNDPNFNDFFNRSMAALSQTSMKGILDSYKGYEGLSSLVDVGGGIGLCLHMVISKYPSIKGINYDLPHVIQSAPSYHGIEHVGGDMFSGVPTADAIMIKDICHNWNDENCIQLIKNCYEALPVNGKLILITTILPEKPETSKASKFVSCFHNVMSILYSGKERTEKEFEALCKVAGFSNFQVICVVYGVWAVMESYK